MQVCECEWRALSSSPHSPLNIRSALPQFSLCLREQVAELVFCEYFEQGDIERNELHVEPAVRSLRSLRTPHTLTHSIAFADYCTRAVRLRTSDLSSRVELLSSRVSRAFASEGRKWESAPRRSVRIRCTSRGAQRKINSASLAASRL